MSVIEKLDSVLALVEKATPGPWLYRHKSNSWHLPPPDGTRYTYGESMMDPDEDYAVMRDADIDLVAALVSLITDHGPAIRQAMIDARRYRFLRRKDAWKETYFATTGGISAIFVSDGRTGHATDTEMLDAAIDARLASDSEGPEADSGGEV